MTNTKEVTTSQGFLPSGFYWVGDPCYAFDSQNEWMALLDSSGDYGSLAILEAFACDKRFVASRTAHGDGVYSDSLGNEFPVDAGLIGVVPMLDCDAAEPFGMTLMEFDGPVTVSYDDGFVKISGGTMRTVIDTDPSEEEGW